MGTQQLPSTLQDLRRPLPLSYTSECGQNYSPLSQVGNLGQVLKQATHSDGPHDGQQVELKVPGKPLKLTAARPDPQPICQNPEGGPGLCSFKIPYLDLEWDLGLHSLSGLFF